MYLYIQTYIYISTCTNGFGIIMQSALCPADSIQRCLMRMSLRGGNEQLKMNIEQAELSIYPPQR